MTVRDEIGDLDPEQVEADDRLLTRIAAGIDSTDSPEARELRAWRAQHHAGMDRALPVLIVVGDAVEKIRRARALVFELNRERK